MSGPIVLADLTVNDMKESLRTNNVSTTGNKPELVSRLEELDPDGNWLQAWKLSRLQKAQNSGASGGDNNGKNAEQEGLKQQLVAMQKALEALTMRLQQQQPTAPVSLGETSTTALTSAIVPMTTAAAMTTTTATAAVAAGQHLVSNLEVSGSPNVDTFLSPRTPISTIAELLGVFDGNGENFESWSQQLEMIRSTYKLNDDTARIMISSKLKGKALTWFHSRPEHLRLPINDLVLEIKKMFYPQLSKIRLRKQFENRIWSQNELFSEYVFDKVILGNKAKIDESELVDHIIEGIPDDTLRDQARMQRFETKENLLCAFEKITLNKKPMIPNKSKDAPKEFSNSKPFPKSDEKSEHKTDAKDSSKIPEKRRCYNCGSYGHLSNVCDKPKRQRVSLWLYGAHD